MKRDQTKRAWNLNMPEALSDDVFVENEVDKGQNKCGIEKDLTQNLWRRQNLRRLAEKNVNESLGFFSDFLPSDVSEKVSL